MTTIEEKALKFVNEMFVPEGRYTSLNEVSTLSWRVSLCRAIEAHEAFRQEVSDAVEDLLDGAVFRKAAHDRLSRFIIPKPDPVVDACVDMGLPAYNPARNWADELRTALAKRGLKIVECEE